MAELTRTPEPREEDVFSIGRYITLGLIGVGGMGAVYAAYDPALDRKIAIKLLRARVLEDSEARLEKEARALAKIAHPNVVAVHDVGEADGRVFIAMELVTGGTIGSWLETKPSWREILAMFVQAGRGLAAAHAAELVHRDFKPDNVLIGEDGRARVTDFGLARAGGDGSLALGSPSLTAEGALVGTPFYMSPEQFASVPADARSDQFSFCVALYFALYGMRPFAGTTVAELSSSVRAGELTRPGRTPVPAKIFEAIQRGLAVDPAARFPSMAALLDRLTISHRRRWIAGVAAIALLGVGIGIQHRGDTCTADVADVWGPHQHAAVRDAFAATQLPYALDASTRITTALDRYGARWSDQVIGACRDHTQALRSSCLAERKRSLRAVVNVLESADRVVVEHGADAVAKLDPLDACQDATELAPQTPTEIVRASAGNNQLAAAKALLGAGKPREAMKELAGIDLVSDPGLRARAKLVQGQLQTYVGTSKLAETMLYDAVNAAEEARDDRTRAAAWIWLVHVVALDRPAAAPIAEARAVLTRLPADDDLATALLIDQGNAAFSVGNYAEAIANFETAHDRRVRTFGANSVEVELVLTDWSQAVYGAGKIDRAIDLARQAVTLAETAYGPKHPLTAADVSNLANVLMGAGKYPEAFTSSQRALQILVDAYGETNSSVGAVLTNLAEISRALGTFEESRAYAKRGRAVYRALADDFGYSRVTINLAILEQEQHHFAAAMQLANEGMALIDAKLRDRQAYVAICADITAGIAVSAGVPSEALPLARRSLAISEQLFGKDSPQLISPLERLAESLEALGKPADEYYARALAYVAAAEEPTVRAEVHYHVARRTNDVAMMKLALADAADDPDVKADATKWLAEHVK